MIEFITGLSLVFSILIVGNFFLLLIIQINSLNNKKLENNFFIIALISGSIAIISYIFDTILWITKPNPYLRINLYLSLFFFFTVCFYFWYKHYTKIISMTESFVLNFQILNKTSITSWLNPISKIDLLFFIGFLLDFIYYFTYFFRIDYIFDIFWNLLGINNEIGRVVTVFSHIAFLSGCVFFYISYIIIKNNLIELKKVPLFEVISIIFIGFANIFLFINDFLLTMRLYDDEIGTFLVNVGLLIIFISLIMLLVNYVYLNPSHVQSPSILKEIAEMLKTIDKSSLDNNVEKIKTPKSQTRTIEALDIPQKLNGTCIIILIYLLKNSESNMTAKDLEINLKLNKSTISYNLKLLENFMYITRINAIELFINDQNRNEEFDQRQKFILINENGRKFLATIHNYLDTIF
jgi:DNA-binding MarR family transcriptional regulator